MSASGAKKLFFSDLILRSNGTKRVAYVGVMTAFCVIANSFFEFRMYDVQFSLTIAVSIAVGVLLGSVMGFAACFIGDLIGFILNSWGQMYMPWVGLSTGVTALIAGMIINGVDFKFKGQLFVKLFIVCLLSLLVCTVGINTTGLYFYYKGMGFNDKIIEYVNERFGGSTGYIAYLFYRMIFKGQIFNSLVNYAVIFAALPPILKIKMFRKEEE